MLRKSAVVMIALLLIALIPLKGSGMSQQVNQAIETGIIFHAHHAERIFGKASGGGISAPYWTPTEEQIRLVESKLPGYLRTLNAPVPDNLKTYKRQYLGYTSANNKVILINGFCDKYWRRDIAWHDDWVFVLDGGACFFRVRYDMTNFAFEGYEVNGES